MVIEINKIQNGLNNEFDIYINKVKKYTGYTSGIVFFRIKGYNNSIFYGGSRDELDQRGEF